MAHSKLKAGELEVGMSAIAPAGMPPATVEPALVDDSWELVLAARDGDAEAFGSLFALYARDIRAVIGGMISDHHLVDDLASETFLRALRAMGRFDYRGVPFRAWLLTIARNIVRDHVRSGYCRTEIVGAEAPVPAQPGPRTPEQQTIRKHQIQDVLRCMNSLTEAQRRCLYLRFYLDLSVEETALRMARGRGAVRQLQRRAVQEIACRLGPQWA